jgi:enoyl-CoA hydratase/carnithine racemase
MTEGRVVVRRRGAATWIGIDRPERRNALDRTISEALGRALTDAEAAGPGVLVLHSTTPGMFVAGTDIADLAARRTEQAMEALNPRLFARIAAYRWPTVAAIDGPALGGGCELALACDLRVASPAARFGQPEPALGIVAGAGAHFRLPQVAGLALARRMLLAGEIVDADTAARAGLVDYLVPADDLEARVDELVERIAARSWRALELTKLALRSHERDTTGFDLAAQALLYESDEAHERLTGFLNRTAARERQ